MKTRVLSTLVMALALLAGSPGLDGRESPKDRFTLEQELQEARERLEAFDRALNFHERKTLRQTSERDRPSLEPALRVKFDERNRLKDDLESYDRMVDLKRQLMALPGREAFASGSALLQREGEAEAVARIAVPAFGELRRHYEMIRPAILHNFFVNVGLKDEGFCWHWARDLTDRLKVLDLETFDLLWATARGGTMREHNTVVLVSKGRELQDGLVLDGWKYAGKPFWIRVTDDKKHPWKVGQYYGGGAETQH
ncbi:MAG TPA: hypothetical protein VFX30_03960 [bacterium]|nr:hypothetical protein [bacterium]